MQLAREVGELRAVQLMRKYVSKGRGKVFKVTIHVNF